ncbi:Fimbrillin-A associated anchor proteins Mfa1 and Mfa2 [Sphingobacterium spiritivorum]|uniref:Fimbrillin-A associated anchor proteins Mfa1 and Mfa2 n=2 Tax=Sphingobacterium spiritivorum TaxID=258 RepID=A0A380BUP3_SPHSI|nr:Fimbrillin-A associated anchor proteins Mfa1 and Mfa2 [Sphingobacterium spiritivorum]
MQTPGKIQTEIMIRYIKCIYVQIFIILILLSTLNGCIKDDLSLYTFEIALSFTDKGGSCPDKTVYTGTSQIAVYAFDQNGYFAGQVSQKDMDFSPESNLKITLPKGNYTLIAWAGMQQGQFEDRLLVKGETHIDELVMPTFTRSSGLRSMPDQVLFHGILKNINAETAAYAPTQRIDLRNITKPLNISLEKYDTQKKYQIRISNNAALCPFEAAELLTLGDHYTITDLQEQKEQAIYTAQTALLWRIEDRNPTITIRDMETGADIFTADVKELLEKIPQLNLNCEPALDLRIIRKLPTEVDVTIMINGWLLVESEGSI